MAGNARATALSRVVVVLAEVSLQILTGAESLARARQHENLGVLVCCKEGQRIAHVIMDAGAHGVTLLRAVDIEPGDAILIFDFDVFIRLVGHFSLPLA